MSALTQTEPTSGNTTTATTTSTTTTTTTTRALILAAAIEILQKQGAGALTVRSVATAAGCSTTGVYTWFGGKNGLVDAIFIDGFRRFGDTLLAARAAAPPDRPLHALADAYRNWALLNPTHYMVMFGRAVPDFEPSAQALHIASGTFDTLVEATAVTIEQQQLDGSPHEIAHFMWAGIHGYVSLELAGMDMTTSAEERTRNFEIGLRRLMRGCRA